MRKRDSISGRVAKSISLTEEFPSPPAMHLLTCDKFFAHLRCSRCSTTSQHFLIICRGCAKQLCCRCSFLEKVCISCKLTFCHPENQIKRSDIYASWQDPKESHVCILFPSPSSRLEFYDSSADNPTNNLFIRKSRFALEVLGKENMEDFPVAVTGLVRDILLGFEEGPSWINLKIIFQKWTLTTRCVRNLKLADLGSIKIPPVQPELWCGAEAVKFVYILTLMSGESKASGDRNLKSTPVRRRHRGMKITLVVVTVTSLLLLFLVDLHLG